MFQDTEELQFYIDEISDLFWNISCFFVITKHARDGQRELDESLSQIRTTTDQLDHYKGKTTAFTWYQCEA